MNIPVSIVRSANQPKIVEQIDLFDLLKRMVNDESLHKAREKIIKAKKEDEGLYKSLKESLPGFILGGFTYRNENSCTQYPKAIGVDIDNLSLSEYGKIFEKVKSWEYTFLAFPSVSGGGIRVIIKTESDLSSHKVYYGDLTRQLSLFLNMPTASTLSDGLKKAMISNEKRKEIIDSTPHIDDVTSDLCRLWFYSGLDQKEIFYRKDAKVFDLSSSGNTYITVPTQTGDYKYVFTDVDKVDYLVNKIEEKKVDVTSSYDDWMKVGFAIYSLLGQNGESYFLRVSQFHSDYDRTTAEKKYRQLSGVQKITHASFYKACSDNGIRIDFNELVEIHRDKFESASRFQEESKELVRSNKALSDSDAESIVIGACLFHENEYEDLMEQYPKFNPSCFTGEKEISVFGAIQRVYATNGKINKMLVLGDLKKSGMALSDLDGYSEGVEIDGYVEASRKIVYDAYVKRMLITSCKKHIEETGKGEDVYGLIDQLRSELEDMVDVGGGETEHTMSTSVSEVLKSLEMKVKFKKEGGDDAITGIPTGLKVEDEFFSGRQPGQLSILAARPGMGKTAKMLCESLAASKAGFAVGIASLEMSHKELTERLISIEAEVDGKGFQRGDFTEIDYVKIGPYSERISQLPIYIDDKPGMTPEYLTRVASKWKRKYDIKILFVDYIQLMSSPTVKGNREQEISDISRKLKNLSKRLDIPVVALAQLSRSVEIRGGSKRPILSDLRESGSLEQDAHNVIFLYRPEYYDIHENEEGESLKNLAEIIIAKGRSTGTDKLYCKWIGRYTKFTDGGEYEVVSEPSGFDPHYTPPPERQAEISTLTDRLDLVPSSGITANRMNDDDDIPF